MLRLAPELKGDLVLGGTATSVADVASSEVDPARGDRAELTFAEGSDLASKSAGSSGRVGAAPADRRPEMIQYMLGTSIVLGIFATILVFMWERKRRGRRSRSAPSAS